MKILIAGDSRVMRQITIRALRQVGYEDHDILEAENGREAVATIEAEQPGLVLCDWHMPEMTGMQCLQAVRSAGSTVSFGFITSDASPDVRREAAAAGALFVLEKPFSADTLCDALDRTLDPEDDEAAPAHDDSPQPVAGDRVPAPKDVRDVFERLLGRTVTVRPGARVQPTPEAPVSLAVYVDAGRSVNVVCLMDLALSAYTAGALALLPAGAVRDAVRDGALSPSLEDALREIANVLSAVVNTPGAPRSNLDRLYTAGTHLPEELLVMASGFERLDLVVDVSGYGEGALSVVRTA